MLFDVLNFLSHITVKKVLILIKLRASYYISIILKKLVIKGYPYSLSIEPTTDCNLFCPECFSGRKAFTRQTGNIKPELYSKIVNELSPYLLYLMLYYQGEPFLHHGLFEMISLANKKKIYTIVSTNGHFFNDENSVKTIKSGLDRIIICIDGLTQDNYNIYRKGGDVYKVIDGIRNLVRKKKELKSKTPFIIVQSLIMRHNQHQLNKMKVFFRKTGVNKVVFKTLQVIQYRNGSSLIPEIEKFSRYQLTGSGDYKIKNLQRNRCWRMWSSAVITNNGMVIPCCFDKDAKYSFGNTVEKSFSDIWKNDNYNNFRTNILRSRKNIKICCNCTEGMKVIFKSS